MCYNKLRISPVLLLLGLIAFAQVALASDADDLTLMLHEFLAEAANEAAHERFWAEDLIYTSSSGRRTSKAEIMQSFSAPENNDGAEAGPVYTAEDIQIRVYGTTAVVAFRLVATPADDSGESDAESEVLQYFNTGTFLKRDGTWQVVAWQATGIPEPL